MEDPLVWMVFLCWILVILGNIYCVGGKIFFISGKFFFCLRSRMHAKHAFNGEFCALTRKVWTQNLVNAHS